MRLLHIVLVIGAAGLAFGAGRQLLAGGPSAETRTSYHASGAVKELAVFEDGRREGHCERYFADGTLRETGEFAAGERTGTWLIYGEDGTLDEERSGEYVEGRRVGPPAARVLSSGELSPSPTRSAGS